MGLFDTSMRVAADWEMWMRLTRWDRLCASDGLSSRNAFTPSNMSLDTEG